MKRYPRVQPWHWIAGMAAVGAAGLFLQRSAIVPTMPFARLGAPIPVAIGMPDGWWIVAIVFAMAAALALLSWCFAGGLTGRNRDDLRWIVAAQITVGLVLSATPLLLSSDVYAYVFWARLEGIWGISPYHRMLINPAMDPFVRFALVAYGDPPPPDSYGPLWTLFVALVARLEAHASLVFNLWSQRFFALVGLVAATIGLSKLALSWGAAGLRRVALFALHPLALYECAVGGHNDMIMVAFAVWAFAVADAWPLVAGLLLGASVAIKWVSALLVPILFIKLLRLSAGRAVLSACMAAAVLIVCMLPFWATTNVAELLPGPRSEVGFSAIGFLYVLGTAFRLASAYTLAHVLIVVFAALFGIAFVIGTPAFAITRSRGAVWATVIAAIWSVPNIFPWYAQWLLPAFADRGRLAAYAWWLGMFAFLDYAFVIPPHVPMAIVAIFTVVFMAAPAYLAWKGLDVAA